MTLLQALMRRRNLTREATIRLLAERAKTEGVKGFSLTVRQLDRLLAGEHATGPRPAARAVLEAEFDFPTDLLLGPADNVAGGAFMGARGGTTRELSRTDLVGWLSRYAGVSFEETYAAVAEAAGTLAGYPPSVVAATAHARTVLRRSVIARAVHEYYGTAPFYRATVADAEQALSLSVLTEDSWIARRVELGTAREQAVLVEEDDEDAIKMRPEVYAAAVQRLAAVEVGDTVLTENPLFRLLDLSIDHDLSARFAPTTFSAYALTVDLLAGELLDALVRHRGRPPTLALRDHYLPSVASARRFGERICAGGPVCLLAIAREDDLLLVVQERSPLVLNAASRLAVVPKAFHQPLGDDRGALLSVTLERELEEELFGREELNQLSPETRRLLAPGHPSADSAPMRWLRTHPESLRTYCCAVGINLLSGNYEIACVAIIEDPAWWDAFGGSLRANWEIERTHCYSSRDRDALARLACDPRWSDEGLFAFLEGLRFLAHELPAKVHAPSIEVSL